MPLPRAMMLIHNFRPGPTGGAEIQAERLARGLLALGHSVGILTNPMSITSQWYDFGGLIPDAPEKEAFYASGDPAAVDKASSNADQIDQKPTGFIYRPPFGLAYNVYSGVGKTFRFLVNNRNTYDVLHCHFAYGHAVVSVVVGKLLHKPCLIKIACAGEFGEFHNFSKFKGFSKAIHVLHQADAMIAISQEVEDELLGYGFSKERIVRIPNGVDTFFFAPKRQNEQKVKGKVRFLLVGRRQPQKGVDLLLHAVRELKSAGLGDRFEVQLCGADSPGYDYKALALELGVSHLVDFLPFQKDMRQFYKDADCFLLPSRGEGLSNALLEAMAMELPVIATRVSGTPEVITNGKDGILIPPGSVDSLVENMKLIISNPDLRHGLGRNARLRVISGFSLQHVAELYSEVYSKLYSGKSK